jgi:DNA-binding NtrC family response regulator
MPSLRFSQGADRVFEARVRPGRTTIGRADSNDIALTGDTISRTHCLIDLGREGLEIIDRSRHGILLDGRRVEQRAPLRPGSRLSLGPWSVEVIGDQGPAAPTAPATPDQLHELLIAGTRGQVTVERAVLVVEDGPEKGQRIPLRAARVSVGGRGSGVALADPTLPPDACFLRISRGRVMIEPGRAAAVLDGERVREITPLYADEAFRLGNTTLRVVVEVEDEAPEAARFGDLVADSREMKQVFGALRRIAAHPYTVLVTGESGTGKELVARGIHQHSSRADRAFIALNCGAISESLFESELFGHEKGAFTGADARRNGAFHDADGGTLFLDEIGELPEAAQTKLLRALETGEVRRVGGTEVSFPDVRVVAATNRDLREEVSLGRFRADLYFRLAVLAVEIPPLRARAADLEPIVKVLCRALHPEAHVTPEALEVLRQHSWPGNVRELRNVLTRAYVLGGPRIEPRVLSFHLLPAPAAAAGGSGVPHPDDAERAYLQSVLARCGDNRSLAARELGVARSTLHYKIRKYNLS